MGGLVSSTAVTFQFSRLSREDEALGTGLAVGVLGASTILLPRILVISAILNGGVARALLPFVLPPLLVGAGLVAFAWARRWDATSRPASVTASRIRSDCLRRSRWRWPFRRR